ncbi:MAG TPA: 16S rRNA (uracil(1498)-N(3))-methyltransferase [Mycobacteriales bacterium]|nr:16S rRNA (uracil(1498)-N(3))-methyltransferase [Mycobacteriales bacterium]
MTAPLFYVVDVAGTTLRLDGPDGHHAAVVRRLRIGERVDAGDGAGRVAECVVSSVGSGVVDLDVVAHRVELPPAPRLVVVQALAKGERAEDAVEAMTEVGVDEIVPWAAARSVARWDGARGEKALARWRVTAREAGKQARRAWLPEVTDLATTAAVVSRLRQAALGVVLHESATTPLAGLQMPAAGVVVVVVGPEGGVSDEELAAFAGVGASAYRLGSSVLRTSTAGVAAGAVILAASGRWS